VYEQKIQIFYIPVKACFVTKPQYWKYSTAANDCGEFGVIEVDKV
jgi:hypothetical protein